MPYSRIGAMGMKLAFTPIDIFDGWHPEKLED
jgi:hypothetical protein